MSLSSPSSASSCAGSRSPSSANHDYFSPLTPDSCFSPAPAIVSPDDFTLQMDVQLDDLAGSPHKSSITHLLPLPQPPVPPPKTDPCFLSGDDMSKIQVFLRNKGQWGNMCDRFESSPPPRPYNPPRVLPDSRSDDLSSALLDPNQLSDPSRCSLLIHEVSLLVGLTADDEFLPPDDPCPFVPGASKQVHDVVPLSLTPTKSLASRRHRNPSLPHPTDANAPFHSPPSGIKPRADNVNPSLQNQGPPLVGSRNLATPIPRHKSADAERPSLSPRRRQGRVFHFEPPLRNAPHYNAFDLDDTFCYPRPPPPKPTSANRCSSLDRLECSLLKLEAHAPSNHRKSRSEGRSSDRVPQRENKRPSLPPRHLKQQQSSYELVPRHPPRPVHAPGPPPPTPRPILPHQYAAPPICPAVPLQDDLLEEDITPGSFMDMDIPHAEQAGPKRRTSLRQVKTKEKVKSLVSVAKRVSQGVIAWGKNLTGSTKPAVTAQETNTVQSACVYHY